MGQKTEALFSRFSRFSRLKEWRPLATRQDRCACIFRSAILLDPVAPSAYDS